MTFTIDRPWELLAATAFVGWWWVRNGWRYDARWLAWTVGQSLALQRRGWPRLAQRVAALAPREPHLNSSAAYTAYLEGDLERAHALLAGLSHEQLAAHVETWNQVVCVLVASGRYREALEARQLVRPPSSERDAVLRINEAEALACLGDVAGSLAWVEGLDTSAPIVRGGLAAHRAWVLAEAGRVDEARAAMVGADALDLPWMYRAEHFYARAFVALAAGEVPTARFAVEAGLACALRPSAERNGQFLLARVLVREGRPDEALTLYAKAAGHRFQGQAGPALLEWGELLAARGDVEGARKAWGLVLARDPQAPAAARARERLGLAGPG